MSRHENSTVRGAGAEAGGLAHEMNTMIAERIPVLHRLGIRFTELREGFVVGTAPLADNSNHLETMYAGTLFGLAEALGGGIFYASFDMDRHTAVVKDVQIRYRRPATSDVRAETSLHLVNLARIKREVEASGRSEFTLDAQLTDTAGAIVATTHAGYVVRSLERAT